MRYPFSIVLTVLLLLPSVGRAQAANPTVKSLEELVSKWSDLRTRIAAEKRDWKEQKTRLAEEARLLEGEKKSWTEELARTQASASSTEKEQAELRERAKKLSESLAAMRPLIDRAEADAAGCRARVPGSLEGQVRKIFEKLPKTQAEADGIPVIERLQTLIALYTQIETLQHGVHVRKELVAVNGGRKRELDVLYLGLARGFAVSADDEWAAVGTPGPEGWTWKPAPDRAANIRKAISVFDRRIPACLVPLPLEVAR